MAIREEKQKREEAEPAVIHYAICPDSTGTQPVLRSGSRAKLRDLADVVVRDGERLVTSEVPVRPKHYTVDLDASPPVFSRVPDEEISRGSRERAAAKAAELEKLSEMISAVVDPAAQQLFRRLFSIDEPPPQLEPLPEPEPEPQPEPGPAPERTRGA